jgi:hypothetical protein
MADDVIMVQIDDKERPATTKEKAHIELIRSGNPPF